MKFGSAALYLLLWLLPVLARADQVWPEPLPVYQAPNMGFNGVGCSTPSGGYALIWQENRTDLWNTLYDNRCFFQRYDSANQAQLPEPVEVFAAHATTTVIGMVPTSDNCFVFYTSARLFKINSAGEQLWGNGVNVPQMPAINRLFADRQGGVYQLGRSSPNGIWMLSHWNSEGSHHGNAYLGLNPVNGSSEVNIGVTLLPNDDLICSFIWNSRIRIVKVNAASELVWERTGYPDEGAVQATQPTFTTDGIHRLIYRVNEGANQVWKTFIVNSDGDQLWAEPVNLFTLSSSVAFDAMNAAPLADGSTLLAWCGQNLLHCVRCDLQGNVSLQGNSVALDPEPAYYDLNLILFPDAAGGAFLHITRQSTGGVVHSQAQYISHSGFALPAEAQLSFTGHPDYGDGGRSLAPYVFLGDERLGIIFELVLPGYSHLIRREIFPTGTLTSPETVSTDLYRTCSRPQICALQGNILTAWLDNEGQNAPERHRIGYQIVSPLGQALLTDWGTLPASGGPRDIGSFRLHSLENGNALVVWSDLGSPTAIRAQQIDAAGNQLWEPEGRIVAASDQFVNLAWGFTTSVQGNDLYVFWTAYPSSYFEIRGQRLADGITQWETGGRVLTSALDFPGEDYYYFSSARVIDAFGDYLCWGRWDWLVMGETLALKWVRVLRFDAEGAPLPGFEAGGNPAFNYGQPYLGLSMNRALLTPQGLLLEAGFGTLHYDPEGGRYMVFDDFYGQLMSPTGETLWGAGYPLATDLSYYRGLLLAGDAEGYVIRTDSGLAKHDYQHQPIWSADLFNFTHLAVQEVAPGFYIGLADRLKYYAFTASGSAWLPADSDLDSRLQTLSTCTLNRDAYVFWADLSLHSVPSYTSLFLQRLSFSTTDADESLIPAPETLILRHYPNPFADQVSLAVESDRSQPLEISVYNIRGQLVRSVYKGEIGKGGTTLVWDGRDADVTEVAPGVYICRARVSGQPLKPVKLLKY